MLKTKKQVARILQITDFHLFADKTKMFLGINPYDSLQTIVKSIKNQINNHAPDLIVFTGDVTQDSSQASYECFASLVSDLPGKKVWLPGNHDTPNLGNHILARHNISNDKIMYFDRWHLILLNSHWAGHVAGKLSEKELDFLEVSLNDSNKKDVIIFLHHHPVKSGCIWLDDSMLANSAVFLELVNRHSNIKAIIFGHIHAEYYFAHRNIEFFGTPATCFQFQIKKNKFQLDAAMPGFRWLDLYDDGSYKTKVERIPFSAQFVPDLNSKGY